jgi:nucleotide-binding universal stress UspA family protein
MSTSESTAEGGGPIVAGVDGSPESLAALNFAVNKARLRGCGVQAVLVWSDAAYYDWLAIPPENWSPDEEAQQDLATIVEDLLASLPGGREQAPPITTLARHGHPAEQLLTAAAEGAQLLVLGSRGRGGFAGLLLGSVGHQCVGRARCPVVVVPGPAPVVVGA